MKLYMICFDKNDILDIVSARTSEEAIECSVITDKEILSDLTVIELTKSIVEKIELNWLNIG